MMMTRIQKDGEKLEEGSGGRGGRRESQRFTANFSTKSRKQTPSKFKTRLQKTLHELPSDKLVD
jgi:hypothetical protein